MKQKKNNGKKMTQVYALMEEQHNEYTKLLSVHSTLEKAKEAASDYSDFLYSIVFFEEDEKLIPIYELEENKPFFGKGLKALYADRGYFNYLYILESELDDVSGWKKNTATLKYALSEYMVPENKTK